jgi:NAD(P)-dependent dehydrogenase (short-subunit alcohol dehydrogenase family)
MAQQREVAYVTGASRGIGKSIALYLAENGYDVAIGARTIHEGEAREHSPTVKKTNMKPLPGSLDETKAQIESRGAKCLPVYLDLMDRVSLGSSVTTILERWGKIDVLVNNGRYIGPGHMDVFMDCPIELIEKQIQANAISPLYLTKAVLPQMIARGSGAIVNITSDCAQIDPPAAAGKGGWGLGYGMSKAAIHKQVGILNVELGDTGVDFFNIQPGLIGTERMGIDMAEYGFDASTMTPVEVIGSMVAWLLRLPDRSKYSGQVLWGQDICKEHNLYPPWSAKAA